MRLKHYILSVLAIFMVMAGASTDARADVTLAPDVTFASKYIWRGQPLNEDPVLQPSVTIGGNGFSLNIWGNVDLTDWGDPIENPNGPGYDDESGNFTEVDYTGGYEQSFGKVTLSGGFITYTFPNTGNDTGGKWATVMELYAGIGVDVLLQPSVTVFVEESDIWGSIYTSIDIGHSFELWKPSDSIAIGLDLSAHVGLADEKFTEYFYTDPVTGEPVKDGFVFHDYLVGVSFPISLPHSFSLTPGASFTGLINEDVKDAVGGVDDINLGWDRDTETALFTLTLAWEIPIKKD